MGLRELFERERDRVWTRLEALGEKHSGLSSLFSRDGDSRVAYLAEAAAYGAARLREQLADDAPIETSAIVGTALPSLLRPTPSMTVVQWRPSSATSHGGLAKGYALHSIPVQERACEFHTAWPIEAPSLVVECAVFEMRGPQRQVLRLRLRARDGVALASALPSSLRLFLKASDPLHALDGVRALCGGEALVRASFLDLHGRTLRADDAPEVRFHVTAFAEPFELFPGRKDAFASGTMLRAFFAFPETFAFVDVAGLRAQAPNADKHARFLELEVPLMDPLSDDAQKLTFELGCAPAVNVRQATAKPLTFTPTAPRLRIEPMPDAEVYEVEAVRMRAPHVRQGFVTLGLWDQDDSRVMRRGDIVARVHRRPSMGGSPAECDLELVSNALPASCSVTTALLVSDGIRTSRLAQGDVTGGAEKTGTVNITRVTPYLPIALGRQLPWRFNGLARIPSADFATAPALRRFLDVHDVTGRRSRSAGGRDARGVGVVTRTPFRRIVLDRVHGGDAVDVSLEPQAFGGVGAAWLVGEILARAFAERTDALRFSHVRWVERKPDNTIVVLADYGLRPGERLPFPFS